MAKLWIAILALCIIHHTGELGIFMEISWQIPTVTYKWEAVVYVVLLIYCCTILGLLNNA